MDLVGWGEELLNLLCPVRYIECSSHFRLFEQFFLYFGGHAKGLPVTKQKFSCWIVDAIMLAYALLGEWPPPGLG